MAEICDSVIRVDTTVMQLLYRLLVSMNHIIASKLYPAASQQSR